MKAKLPKPALKRRAKPHRPAPTLDDAAILLVQLEPTDVSGFEKLKGLLHGVAASGLPTSAASFVDEAVLQIDHLLAGETPDGEDTLIEVSRLLEAAAEPIAAQETTAVPEFSPPDPRERPQLDPEILFEDEEPSALQAARQEANRPEAGNTPSAPSAADPPIVPETLVDQLPPDADSDLLSEFVTESREMLEGAEGAMLELESDPAHVEAVNRVFRAFHTIKGTSGFLGLTRTSSLAHHAESLLSRIRNNEIRFSGGYADLSLRAVDMLKGLIQGVADALSGRPMLVPAGYDELRSLLSNPEAAGISEQATSVQASRELLLTGSEADEIADQEDEKVPAAAPEASAGPAGSLPAGAASTRKAQQQAARADSKVESSVRVSTARLDRLIDMVGELVIAQSMVAQDRSLLGPNSHELLRKVAHAGKIVRELQDLSMSMRMIPLKATFQKMHRLVRDLAHKSGKAVTLVAEDRDTEIDRHMVDIINDLLVHMVRNAVDHGIEPPDVRAAEGKDRSGTIYLSAFHSGGSVVVEIRDDGRGLNRERILQKAIATGLVDPDKNFTDGEAYNLIFAAGFSTAERVTDVSGRGVGMDVVRKGVEALRGRIDVTSVPGKGSTFAVRLPLTLAITDGMLVKVGPDRYIVPTVNIHLCFRPRPEQLSTVAGRGEMVLLRGELMPIFRLHRLFDVHTAIEDPTAALFVVVGDGERRCALQVDELLGQQQFVAKSLGDGVGKVQGVSGGAILGDGRVGLILDPSEIASLARQSVGRWGGVGRSAA